MKQLYIGIDLGSSSMKILLMDETCQILAHTAEDYQIDMPQNGWREINQEIWFDHLVSGIRKVLEGQNVSLLKSIGITGQMHTLVILDKEGRYIRPALMWNDSRTKDMLPYLKKMLSGFEEGDFLSRLISIGSPAANLYWLKEKEPESFDRIGRFMIGPDYLVYRLTGNHVTDYCEASTSCLYEISNRRWSEEMRSFLGLDRKAYPEIKGSAQIAGTVSREMGEVLGIPSSVVVLTGTGDNPATAISTGCLSKGFPVISLGTSGVLMMPISTSQNVPAGKKILLSFDNKNFCKLVQGTVQSNGATLDWWGRKILHKENFDFLDRMIHLENQKNNSILFYPHLSGDKVLYADPDLRGMIVGFGTYNTEEDLSYAVLEGICFGFRELAEKMDLSLQEYGAVKVVGGGAKSKIWMQIMANVLNVRVERLEGNIGAAYGIALLAAAQNREISEEFSLLNMDVAKVDCCFEPDHAMTEICNRKYEKYKRIHDAMKYITEGTSLPSFPGVTDAGIPRN